MAAALPIIMIASTVFSAVGKQQQGAEADRAAGFQAAQLEQRAQASRASAQRVAREERHRAELANSALQARAGGGGLDPTIVDLSAGITGEGEYRALTAMYEGEERARGDEMAAETRRYEGRQARRAGNMGAVTSLFSAAGSSTGQSLFAKYGG
jgi:hypothetical protein